MSTKTYFAKTFPLLKIVIVYTSLFIMEINNQLQFSSPPPPLSSRFPVLSWQTTNALLWKQMLEAKEGVILFKDLNFQVPMFAVRDTFCTLYANPEQVKYLNDLDPERGIFKNAAFYTENIDQKIMIDFSHQQLHTLQNYVDLSVHKLGQPFLKVVEFYNYVKSYVIPRLLYLCEAVIKKGANTGKNEIIGVHHTSNVNFRLVDYLKCKTNVVRCGEHCDFGTFTIIFQDKMEGGLEVRCNNEWVPIPKNSEMVFLWDWSSFIFSNGRIHPPLRRVVPVTEGKNWNRASHRFEAIFRVAPDMDALLGPILPSDTCAFDPKSMENLTVQKLYDLVQLKFHEKEGTLTADERKVVEQKRKEKKSSVSCTPPDNIILKVLLGQFYNL